MEAINENTHNCEQCGEPFKPLRKDALFCSATCRWSHWKSKRVNKQNNADENQSEQKQNTKPLSANLQGVISEDSESIPATGQYEEKGIIVNPDWLDTMEQKDELIKARDRIRNHLHGLIQAEINIKNDTGKDMIIKGIALGGFGGAVIGTAIDQSTHKENKTTNGKTKKVVNKNKGAIFCFVTGVLLGGVIAKKYYDNTKDQREAIKQQTLADLRTKISLSREQLRNYELTVIRISNKVDSIPKQIAGKELVLISAPTEQIQNSTHQNSKQSTLSPNEIPLKPENENQEKGSDKIISSIALEKMDYKALRFQDKWVNFFGYPSINFHCVIHGMSGEGKSTFAIQFANYLAENFGKVIYVSGEEGFSKTFKDKFTNNKATSDNLFVADLRKLNEMFSEIPNDEYNFIFIDSLDNMRIDADSMKKIRTHYKDSALITISQSTKDGKMRGSYEIVHDSDIAVIVENGIATTTKNRFKQKGIELNVF